MNFSFRKLDRKPAWMRVYKKQLLKLLSKVFICMVLDEELEKWKQDVFNSSQMWHSLLRPFSKDLTRETGRPKRKDWVAAKPAWLDDFHAVRANRSSASTASLLAVI